MVFSKEKARVVVLSMNALLLVFFYNLGINAAFVSAQGLSETWQKAIQACLDKNYPESIRLIDGMLLQKPLPAETAALRFFLAENYYLNNQTEPALAMYQTAADTNGAVSPLKVSARYRMAELYYNQEQYQKSGEVLNDLLHSPQAEFLFPQIPLTLVRVNLKLNRNAEAQKIFSGVLDVLPRALLDPEIKFLYGIMKEYQGKPLDALRIYSELGENALAHLFTGAILEAQGRFMPAIEAYDRAAETAQVPSHRQLARYFKMRSFYKSGDFLAAESMNRKFMAEYPDSPYRPQSALLLLLIWLAQARYNEVLEGYPPFINDFAKLTPPDRALFHFMLGEAALNLDQYSEAVLHYSEAVKTAVRYRDQMFLKLAYAQMALKNWPAADDRIHDYFREIKTPEPIAQLIALKSGLETQHESAAFQAAQELARSNDPLIELGLYWVAAYYIDQKQPQKLVAQWTVLESILKDRPVKNEYRQAAAWARLLMAEAFYQEGNFSSASEYYNKALILHPRDTIPMQVYAGLIWCEFKLQNYASVQSYCDKIFALPQVPEPLATELSLVQAHAYFNLKQYPPAILAYERWLKNSPRHPQAAAIRFQIGWAHYLSKAYLEAVEAWQALVDQFPQAPESQPALFWIGDIYFQAGENQKARAIYEKVLKDYPETTARRANELRIAQTYYNETQDDEAVRRFTAIMLAYPKTEEANEAQKGIEAASYRVADRLNSIPAFREYIDKFPTGSLTEDIRYRIGEAYFTKAKYAESLEEFLQFVLVYTKSPRTPNAQYYIAVCQEQLGHLPEAITQAEAFLKNFPQHELAAEMMFRQAANEFQLTRYAAAAEHFVACAENYALKEYQPRAWYNAAVTYEKLQLPEPALANYEKLIKHFPQDANVSVSLSRMAVLYAQQQNPVGVENILALFKDQPDRELFQKTALQLAAYYKEQNQLAEEEKVLQQVVAQGVPKSKEYSTALVELASMYEQSKAWKEARGIYQRLAATTTEVKWRQAANKRIGLLNRIIKSQ